MRAVQITRTGGPEVLEFIELPDPEPGPDELLVDVAVAGVNYIDTYHREGVYPLDLPLVLGIEGTGRVRAAGSAVEGFTVGQRVAWAEAPGSYAQRVVVPAARAVPVPDAVPDDVAVGAMLQGVTAHFLVHDTFPVQPGQDVLVHAAAGGMGLLLTQWVTGLGGRVIATVSTPEKEELARAAGAAEVIRYTEVDDLAAAVRELTGGVGVAVAYDGVGRSTFDASLAALRRRGMLVLYGAASGAVAPVDPQRLNAAGSVFLTRPKLFDHITTSDELTARASAVYAEVTQGRLDVRIGHRHPLADARRAHEELQGRATTGKVLLLP